VIEVEQVEDGDPMRFQVQVSRGEGTSSHEVSLAREDHERIAPSAEPDHLVEASFAFLLDREPKEQILSSFELPVIERYFGEYTDEIQNYL
jgi:hypothetical protein